MSDAQDRKNDEADTSRAVAFSDGIFAIIITLLVLDLQPPEAEPGQLLSGLLRQWPTYLAYLTSYLYVAVGCVKLFWDRVNSVYASSFW